jgi:hypothetical protein
MSLTGQSLPIKSAQAPNNVRCAPNGDRTFAVPRALQRSANRDQRTAANSTQRKPAHCGDQSLISRP